MNFFTPSDEGVKKFIENELFFISIHIFLILLQKFFLIIFCILELLLELKMKKKKEKKKKLESEEKNI